MYLWNLLGLTFLGSVAGILGGVIFLVKKDWAKNLSSIAAPLATGVLLSVALLDLLPESVERIDAQAYTAILVVFIVLFIFESYLFNLHHHDHNHEHKHEEDESTIPLIIAGDTLHNFMDGAAIAAAYLASPSLGLLVAISTFLHETPHEIADFGILLSRGWARKKVFITNLLSSLATFPGALLVYFYPGDIETKTGYILAIAAALFLYIATTDLLPEMAHLKKGSANRRLLFLLLGVALIVLSGNLIPGASH